MKFKGQRDFHTWYLEGKKVKGSYLGEYPFTGVVENTRVCLGGVLKHWVKLDAPIYVTFSDEPERTHVYILEHFDEEENELEEILE
jgi:hypothetical protein